jgi:hypothetical protein
MEPCSFQPEIIDRVDFQANPSKKAKPGAARATPGHPNPVGLSGYPSASPIHIFDLRAARAEQNHAQYHPEELKTRDGHSALVCLWGVISVLGSRLRTDYGLPES